MPRQRTFTELVKMHENASMGAVGGGAIASTPAAMPGIRKRTQEKKGKTEKKSKKTDASL